MKEIENILDKLREKFTLEFTEEFLSKTKGNEELGYIPSFLANYNKAIITWLVSGIASMEKDLSDNLIERLIADIFDEINRQSTTSIPPMVRSIKSHLEKIKKEKM